MNDAYVRLFKYLYIAQSLFCRSKLSGFWLYLNVFFNKCFLSLFIVLYLFYFFIFFNSKVIFQEQKKLKFRQKSIFKSWISKYFVQIQICLQVLLWLPLFIFKIIRKWTSAYLHIEMYLNFLKSTKTYKIIIYIYVHT